MGHACGGALVEQVRDADASEQQHPDLCDDLVLGDLAGWDWAVRLVDGIDVAVVPVIDGLRVPCEEGPCHDHAQQQLPDLLRVVPLVVAGGSCAAADACIELT